MSRTSWTAGFGAEPLEGGTRFRVWAPGHDCAEVVLDRRTHGMKSQGDGWFEVTVPGEGPGTRYRHRFDGGDNYPDPASRSQPEGVFGPSEVVDPARWRWNDDEWSGLSGDDAILYELHVGCFTPEGTFDAIVPRLGQLRDIGVTALELMPVAEFAGERNWGYDGAYPFAPSRVYGGPDGLARLVDAAHAHGLGIVLDVVYNHLGPEGSPLPAVTSGRIFAENHDTPWGKAINFDETGSTAVRDFFIANALYWIRAYHIDGLRLDATHAIRDDSTPHFLEELTSRVRENAERPVLLIAEDERNEPCLIQPVAEGGFGFDAVWADDLHHQLRRLTAGDREGYFTAYGGTIEDVVTTLRRGWFRERQSPTRGRAPRRTPPDELPPRAFVHCIQNHDQVGNRALGDRIHHDVPLPVYRALTALLLFSPYTPLLWMGQEWAASSPFLYFTDFGDELGRLVTEGRREEFSAFSAFADAAARERIPDPQGVSTFERSLLCWPERDRMPHAGVLELYRALLALRRSEPALRLRNRDHFAVATIGDRALALRRESPDGPAMLLVACMEGPLRHATGDVSETRAPDGRSWTRVLATEERRFGADRDTAVFASGRIELDGEGAVVLRAQP